MKSYEEIIQRTADFDTYLLFKIPYDRHKQLIKYLSK